MGQNADGWLSFLKWNLHSTINVRLPVFGGCLVLVIADSERKKAERLTRRKKTMKNTQDINADWLARIQELTDAIAPLATERTQLEQKVLESKSPFVVGDIIEWNKGARRGRVTAIVRWCVGDMMWKVARLKKDGSEGEIVEVRPYQDVRRAND